MSLEKLNIVNAEMISMLVSTSYERFKEQTEIFEHHDHVTYVR
jgi:hypothetical protein